MTPQNDGTTPYRAQLCRAVWNSVQRRWIVRGDASSRIMPVLAHNYKLFYF